MLYVASNVAQKVVKIDPATNTVAAVIPVNDPGTTGLYAGTYNGTNGVFVANTGGYSVNPVGSIDFIANGSTTAATVTSGATFGAGRLVQLANGNLFATGYSGTWLVTLSGALANASQLLPSGSFSIACKGGLVYVPVNTWGVSNKLYVFDSTGVAQSYSPVSVMAAADNIANVAFYQ